MSGPRLLLVPTVIAALGAPALASIPEAEAVRFSDNFDNNTLDAWRSVADLVDATNPIGVAETNQRLEYTFAQNTAASARAGLAGRLWWLDSSQPFKCRITGHLTPTITGNGIVGFFVQFASGGSAADASMTDGVRFEYNVNDIGAYVAFRHYEDGDIQLQNTFLPAVTGDATAYFEYDGNGTLCASLLGYGDQDDTVCVNDLFPEISGGVFSLPPRVLVMLGGMAEGATSAVDPIDAWMDDFVIDAGTAHFVEIADDGDSGPDDTGEPDANADGRVDLDDLAIALRSGGGSERLTAILEESGFDSADFSVQQWSKLMNGLYTHRIAPFLYPPPSKTEASAAIATLTSLYVGPITGPVVPTLPDTGTPDANDDGFVDFADVARVLEANTADKTRLSEILQVIGLDADAYPKKKYWKQAIIPIYESEIVPEFDSARSSKDTKKDLKLLFKAY